METGRLAWALSGMSAAAVAVGTGEIVAALLGGSSIVASIGALVIALQPPGGKDLFVALFGTNDKLVLEVGIAVGGIAVGALLGLIARRDIRLAAAGFAAFGLVAFLLVQRDPLAGVLPAAVSVLSAVLAGILMLSWLASALGGRGAGRVAWAAADASPTPAPRVDRRGFLFLGGVFIAAGGVLALIGRYLGSQLPSTAPPVSLPSPGQTLAPVPPGTAFDVAGLTPIVVPNSDFYRIDTRLDVPRLDSATWTLVVRGMVEREVTYSYAELAAMPLFEQYVTIACVSNDVGGHLVGNAKWTGVRLTAVLDRAGVQPGATQLVGRSFDWWTCGFPTDHLAGAGREAMIALAMNDEPLPPAHGFPARLIVPGLYGYVSATKWLTEIEMTTLDAFDAYWVPLGWAKQAPILTQSRIDLPRRGGSVAAGPVEAAGVAWAPTRGISRVEVQVDDGEWVGAELSVPLSSAAWIQWRVVLDVAPGSHLLRVRATDGTGETQTAERTPAAPDGARGYHEVTFTAS